MGPLPNMRPRAGRDVVEALAGVAPRRGGFACARRRARRAPTQADGAEADATKGRVWTRRLARRDDPLLGDLAYSSLVETKPVARAPGGIFTQTDRFAIVRRTRRCAARSPGKPAMFA